MARITIKEILNSGNSFGEGGSSFIFGAYAEISFISSTDLQLEPINVIKTDKLIAIKKLKPGA